MLEDANKSGPDVICIRAGFQPSYLCLQMFILMGYCAILQCRPSWPSMHVLSNARTLFFKMYHFSPIEWLLVTRGAKNVTPVETQSVFLPVPCADTLQSACLWNHDLWALGKAGGRCGPSPSNSSAWDKVTQLHGRCKHTKGVEKKASCCPMQFDGMKEELS